VWILGEEYFIFSSYPSKCVKNYNAVESMADFYRTGMKGMACTISDSSTATMRSSLLGSTLAILNTVSYDVVR
jgi:hypothetical protein